MKTRIYIASVCAAGLLLLFLPSSFEMRDAPGFMSFLALGALAQVLPIRFYKNASVSMSMAVALAAILVFGPTYAAWVNLGSGLVHYWMQVRPRNRPFYCSAVTTSTLIIAAWVSGQFYVTLGGQVGTGSDDLYALLLLAVAGGIYYSINTCLITAAISLEQNRGFWELLKTNYQWLTVNIASLTPLGFGIALMYQRIGMPGLLLFLLPMAIAWYSFHLYSRSMDDVRKANEDLLAANEHVTGANRALKEANEQLNVMYEVSRSLAGSLYLDATLDRIVAATKLFGLPASFVAGPLSEKWNRVPHWRASDLACGLWSQVEPDKLTQTALGRIVASSWREPGFRSGEPRVVTASECGLQVADALCEGEESQLSIVVLIPLIVRIDSWWVVGVGSERPPTAVEIKELLIFRSMTESALEMALTHEQAQRDALIDPRTGLYNHRYFQEAIQRELQGAGERNGFLAFLMLDIDNFKEFNDVYGHLVGDQALEVVARLIRENVRETDTVCRYGGDEMCVLLPNTDKAMGIEIASRIDQAICAHTFHSRRECGVKQDGDVVPGLRVSIGLSTFPESAQTRAGLIEKADRACYRAKSMGGGVATDALIEGPSERAVSRQYV